MDHCRGMLDLARGSDDGRLAVRLDRAHVDGLKQFGHKQLAKLRGDRIDLRPEVLDEPAAGPWILDDGSGSDCAIRTRHSLAALDEDVLDDGDDLANLGVHGGIAQGLGQALLEEIRFDRESGQLLTGSFMDYAMPRAGDMPR
ncbi:MAG: molybdopterin-dependent oxidoreductase, partial [Rhodospirillales bacterium]|nr:molybdopterin-dependent oxidoreductase [Rhodospirillales bacterium]